MVQTTNVTDPVCGMIIDSATATSCLEFQGETYYFCSEDCKQLFDAAPASYIDIDARTASPADDAKSPVDQEVPLERHEPRFTKAGGIVAPKFGAAGSGGAEYERLPEAHDDRKPG